MFKNYSDLVLFARAVNPEIKNKVAQLTDYRFYPEDTRKKVAEYDNFSFENGQIAINKKDNTTFLDYYVNFKGGNKQSHGKNKDYFLTIRNFNLNHVQNMLAGVYVEELVVVEERDAENFHKYSTSIKRTAKGVQIENKATTADLDKQNETTNTTKINLSMFEFYKLVESLKLNDLVTPFQA